MAFGWLSGKKDPVAKALDKAQKLSSQGRWAEALSYFEEARGASPGSSEARAGVRNCKERLVAWNLEEARAYAAARDLEKAREHGQLALDLAAGETDLQEQVRQSTAALGEPPAPAPQEPPSRLFPPSCACPEPCDSAEATEATAEDIEVESLFEFYLESLSAVEREALEPLGPAFQEGFVYLQQGETEKARPLLDAAAEAAPGAGTYYALGLLAALDKDQEAAATAFSTALQHDPSFAPAAHHRADVLREHGEPREAARLLGDWLGEHPDDGEAWVLLGACQLEAGNPDAGLQAANEAARRAQEADPRPQLLKARALRSLGRTDEALQAFQSVAARRPDLLDALVPLGRILIEKGGASAERAAEVFKHCYRLDPERGWWHLLRVAEAYSARGWKAEAQDVAAAAGRELPPVEEAKTDWAEVSRAVAG